MNSCFVVAVVLACCAAGAPSTNKDVILKMNRIASQLQDVKWDNPDRARRLLQNIWTDVEKLKPNELVFTEQELTELSEIVRFIQDKRLPKPTLGQECLKIEVELSKERLASLFGDKLRRYASRRSKSLKRSSSTTPARTFKSLNLQSSVKSSDKVKPKFVKQKIEHDLRPGLASQSSDSSSDMRFPSSPNSILEVRRKAYLEDSVSCAEQARLLKAAGVSYSDCASLPSIPVGGYREPKQFEIKNEPVADSFVCTNPESPRRIQTEAYDHGTSFTFGDNVSQSNSVGSHHRSSDLTELPGTLFAGFDSKSRQSALSELQPSMTLYDNPLSFIDDGPSCVGRRVTADDMDLATISSFLKPKPVPVSKMETWDVDKLNSSGLRCDGEESAHSGDRLRDPGFQEISPFGNVQPDVIKETGISPDHQAESFADDALSLRPSNNQQVVQSAGCEILDTPAEVVDNEEQYQSHSVHQSGSSSSHEAPSGPESESLAISSTEIQVLHRDESSENVAGSSNAIPEGETTSLTCLLSSTERNQANDSEDSSLKVIREEIVPFSTEACEDEGQESSDSQHDAFDMPSSPEKERSSDAVGWKTITIATASSVSVLAAGAFFLSGRFRRLRPGSISL